MSEQNKEAKINLLGWPVILALVLVIFKGSGVLDISWLVCSVPLWPAASLFVIVGGSLLFVIGGACSLYLMRRPIKMTVDGKTHTWIQRKKGWSLGYRTITDVEEIILEELRRG